MLKNVFLKALRDRRRSIVFWSGSLALFGVFMMLFYPTIRSSQALIQQYIDMLPKGLMSIFAGDIASYGTPAGFLNSELFFLMVPMLLTVFAVGFGSEAIAGEEEKGHLDLLLSWPLPRWRLVVEKAGALVVLTVALAVVLWVGLAIGITAVKMDIALARVWAACLSAVLLGLTFGMLALMLGGITGNKGLAIGASGGLAVVTYLVNALAPSIDILKSLQGFSPFYYYIGIDPLTQGLNAGHVGVLLGIIAVTLTAAVLAFRHRDIAV